MKRLLLFSLATILVLTGSLACADNDHPTVKIASFNILRLGLVRDWISREATDHCFGRSFDA